MYYQMKSEKQAGAWSRRALQVLDFILGVMENHLGRKVMSSDLHFEEISQTSVSRIY